MCSIVARRSKGNCPHILDRIVSPEFQAPQTITPKIHAQICRHSSNLQFLKTFFHSNPLLTGETKISRADPCSVEFHRETAKFCLEFCCGVLGGFFSWPCSKEKAPKKLHQNTLANFKTEIRSEELPSDFCRSLLLIKSPSLARTPSSSCVSLLGVMPRQCSAMSLWSASSALCSCGGMPSGSP